MRKRYLILGPTMDTSTRFARENNLTNGSYTVVTDPQRLKGYSGETVLFVLDGWREHLSYAKIGAYNEAMYFFRLRNEVRTMGEWDKVDG